MSPVSTPASSTVSPPTDSISRPSLLNMAPTRVSPGTASGITAAAWASGARSPNRRAASQASNGSGATTMMFNRRRTQTCWS